MKTFYLLTFLVVAFFSCKPDSKNPDKAGQPRETQDWLILTAPEEREVWGVYGNIDSTLVISTGYKLYYTQDRGKSWHKSDYSVMAWVMAFAPRADTLFTLSSQWSSSAYPEKYAANPGDYSTDQGKSWFSIPPRTLTIAQRDSLRVPRNRLKAANGVVYEIDQLLTPTCPNCSSSYVQTIGYKTSTGRRVALPQEHQIQSIYLDSQQRLYISGSAAVCGGIKDFKFCDGQRGVIYISKKPLP
ncbi:beta propeller repeat protein [Siphonobacter curvatus]|uniref:Exo-alpha-sialidase n=1 Tax=Siphonobacter curvatus TaxID=2094562 RepID=A0A2S7IPT8_9BACT|nr:hypothetical protein [Siphonobacter curvatus]PQA59679.1 hypothetical protein C5O19_08610 [Siphonobacter curvatus]